MRGPSEAGSVPRQEPDEAGSVPQQEPDEAGFVPRQEPDEAGSVPQQRLRFDLCYDGSNLHGWAKQDGLRTVQGELEHALTTIMRQPISLTVAGRTDSGVHAKHQVAHCDVAQFEGDPQKLRDRINGILASSYSALWRPLIAGGSVARGTLIKGEADIVVTAVATVPGTFDARFSATGRQYRYLLSASPQSRDPLTRNARWWVPYNDLDVTAMNNAARVLLGEHDFLSFCKPREGATTIRTLRHLEVVEGEDGDLAIEVSADAFCHSMVRSLVGALVEVGRGARDEDWMRTLVDNPTRGHGVPVAPARGLTLMGVTYPPEREWSEQSRRARTLRTLGSCTEC